MTEILIKISLIIFGIFIGLVFRRYGSKDTELLDQAMKVQELQEAWIYTGEDCNTISLSSLRDNNEINRIEKNLRKVELRLVLDDSPWNLQGDKGSFFGIIESRRTWIVRDTIAIKSDCKKHPTYPSIISSKGLEELSAWIENVHSSRCPINDKWNYFLEPLSRRGLKKLKVLLFPLVKEDKIYIFDFNKRLMKKTIKFMRDCRKSLNGPNQPLNSEREKAGSNSGSSK